MTTRTSQLDDDWFVASGASHHMTCHKKWFVNLREPEKPGMVQTSDDSKHMIEHIGDVSFSNHDNKGYIKDILHVPTNTNNLVLDVQLVK